MSFKIFSLQLTGKIKPVAKIEQQREILQKDYQEFLQVEVSDELKEYLKLESFVNSGDFKKIKAEITALQLKGSKEQKQLLEFEKLKKSKHIKNYFKVVDSSELKRFEKMKDSDVLKELGTLKKYIKEGQYQNEKKGEKKEEAKAKYAKYKSLSGNADIKFFFRFQKSSLLKNYLDVKVSHDLERYNELKQLTGSKEFLERKAYLEDKQKWEKTEEFKKQKKYEEVKRLPHIEKYFKYKNSNAFDFLKQWKIVFEDKFSSLDKEKWITVQPVADNLLGENYAMPGDLHIFTAGKNVKTDGKLTVEVRKEKVRGKVWNMPSGFVPVDFEYTSGLVSTAQGFSLEDGILEAKIKFNPVKEVVSTLALSGEKQSPRVNVLEMGTKNRLGVSTLNNAGKVEVEGLDIKNLKSGVSYIFSLEKSGKTLVWKINETEVLRLEKSEFRFPLHLEISSIPVYEIQGHNLPVKFEIDWIKCYRKK